MMYGKLEDEIEELMTSLFDIISERIGLSREFLKCKKKNDELFKRNLAEKL
jgi:chorismate mutase